MGFLITSAGGAIGSSNTDREVFVGLFEVVVGRPEKPSVVCASKSIVATEQKRRMIVVS